MSEVPAESRNEEEEARRIAEAVERSRRAYREIRLWGDPVLRSTASPVNDFGPSLRSRIEHMAQVMRDAPGQGLAAPQIGSLQRILIYQLPVENGIEASGPTALVNPRIVEASEEREMFLEGCLSIPSLFVAMERSVRVVVEASGPVGEPIEIEAEGMHASVLQHEVDHLDGVLLPDRLDRGDRREFLRAIRAAAAAGWPAEDQLIGAAAEILDARVGEAVREGE
jgi:peptide deformylase